DLRQGLGLRLPFGALVPPAAARAPAGDPDKRGRERGLRLCAPLRHERLPGVEAGGAVRLRRRNARRRRGGRGRAARPGAPGRGAVPRGRAAPGLWQPCGEELPGAVPRVQAALRADGLLPGRAAGLPPRGAFCGGDHHLRGEDAGPPAPGLRLSGALPQAGGGSLGCGGALEHCAQLQQHAGAGRRNAQTPAAGFLRRGQHLLQPQRAGEALGRRQGHGDT
ncbi:unnamed protein product, partial [Effrenium voratum]